jgi:hypothetical protein
MLRSLGLGLLLVAGLGSAAWAQSPGRFDGQYAGQLILEETLSGYCTEPPPGAVYPLTISKGHVRFTYTVRFDTELNGKVADDGTFEAHAHIKKGSVRMTGRIHGNSVIATVISPSCHYTFRTG